VTFYVLFVTFRTQLKLALKMLVQLLQLDITTLKIKW